jgi:hypothetical protein
MIKLKDLINEIVSYDELTKKEELVQKYMDKMVDEAPGKNREEKLSWVWKEKKEQFQKLFDALTALNNMKFAVRRKGFDLKRSTDADQYYIRFGDLPKSGKSMNHYLNKTEKGISVYPVNWSQKYNKWELDASDLSEVGLSTLDSMVVDFLDGKGRPIYLIYAKRPTEHGVMDIEPVLNSDAKLDIVKKLHPSEVWIDEFGGEDWWHYD